jgi:hypothetical protein
MEFFLVFLFLFISSNSVNAAFSFSISSPSATLINSGGQEIDVSLNITDLPSESYFRVSLQKDTGGSYYGYIKNNNGDWSKIQTLSGDCTGYFKVSDLNTNLINLKFKIGDDTSIDNGAYNFKAHRFVKTCSSYTEAINSIPLTVELPSTSTPTPTSTPTTSPTVSPTVTPTVKPTPTKSPSPRPTTSPTPIETELPNINNFMLNDAQVSSPKPIEMVKGVSTENRPRILALIFFVSGALFLGYGGFLLYNQRHGKIKETS